MNVAVVDVRPGHRKGQRLADVRVRSGDIGWCTGGLTVEVDVMRDGAEVDRERTANEQGYGSGSEGDGGSGRDRRRRTGRRHGDLRGGTASAASEEERDSGKQQANPARLH